ncbi:Tubulin specific chaperone E [Giardia lamblia P15]|uniref:Tubulin specific chaperone E n=1 Tax=Giardia intestinalis (strain P15) TaxID=658858 RepID=E1F566_GIAIA|nr:Tubulin specific chaperone E [Giardia lamblia P15]
MLYLYKSFRSLILEMSLASDSFFVNQRVRHSEHPEQVGTIRYVGPIKGQTSNYCGVEWDSPVGKYDGEYQGTRYFSCVPLYGSFVHVKRLIPATSLWDAILDRYVTGREVSGLETMFVTDGIRDTRVHFYGQHKLDQYHQHLENLTDIDLQGYDIGHLNSTDNLSVFSRLTNLRFLELSFTLLNDPIDVLTLLCAIPSLEVILVNGCNVRWHDLFEIKPDRSGNSNIDMSNSVPSKRQEFVRILHQLRRRKRRFSIYTNAQKRKPEFNTDTTTTAACITGLSLRALLYLPNLTELHIDFWTLSPKDISWVRHQDLLQLSAASSFSQSLSEVLVAMARAFPKLKHLSLCADTKQSEPNCLQKCMFETSIRRSYLHTFQSLTTLNLSGRSLDISLLRLMRKLCPLIEDIIYEEIHIDGVPVPQKEHKAYAVAMLGPQLKVINWIPLSAEDISSEERFYISIWFISAMKLNKNDLRKYWKESPEVSFLLRKHNLQLPGNRIKRLLEFVPEIRAEGIKGVSDWNDEQEDRVLSSVEKRYRGKLIEITLLDSHYSKQKSPKKILLPKSTCIWRLIAILKENYGMDVSHGMVASSKNMYGENISSLSLYTPIGDITGTECRIRV